MTVIAWDGRVLAADKLCCIGTTTSTVTKIKIIDGSMWGGCGDFDTVQSIFKWAEEGKIIEGWPLVQKDKDRWASVINITKEGK